MGGRVAPVAWGSLAALAGLGGAAAQLQQAALWPLPAYAGLIAVALLLVGVAVWRPRAAWAGVIGLALLAFGLTGWRADLRLAQALPPALEGQDLRVEGVIARMPQSSPIGRRFVFDVDQAWLQGQPVTLPPRISLGWYSGFDDDALSAAALADLRAGQRWRLTVRLRQPHGALNPHGFDFELWLFEQGIRASGSVRPAAALKLDENAGHAVERLRQRIGEAIAARVPDRAAAGVLAALAVGDQAAIERDDWELFRVTGVAHLMSISGIHVTLF
ncbi:MAG: ComEC/Rec2 family competence protein [Rubrivivax sp.]|nr:ComEC/Rec2 family competence protein [Rubrivivax sp.]